MKSINKFILWLSRRWCKTARGKWHIEKRALPLRRSFIPACRPWAIWKAVASKNHMPPKDGVMCKICKKMMEDGLG